MRNITQQQQEVNSGRDTDDELPINDQITTNDFIRLKQELDEQHAVEINKLKEKYESEISILKEMLELSEEKLHNVSKQLIKMKISISKTYIKYCIGDTHDPRESDTSSSIPLSESTSTGSWSDSSSD